MRETMRERIWMNMRRNVSANDMPRTKCPIEKNATKLNFEQIKYVHPQLAIEVL